MALSKRSKSGQTKFATWLVFVSGLLIALIAFLRSKALPSSPLPIPPAPVRTSPIAPANPPNPPAAPLPSVPANPEIDYILVTAGYSPVMAAWWSAISKHETANYTSLLFRQYNNLFGMGVPSVRRSLRNGEVELNDGGALNKFSTYASTKDCIQDLVIYMQSMRYPTTFNSVDDLVAFMKGRGYFTASLDSYLAGVKRYL